MDREEADQAWRAAQAERWEQASWANRAGNYSEVVVIGVIVILGTLILWMMS